MVPNSKLLMSCLITIVFCKDIQKSLPLRPSSSPLFVNLGTHLEPSWKGLRCAKSSKSSTQGIRPLGFFDGGLVSKCSVPKRFHWITVCFVICKFIYIYSILSFDDLFAVICQLTSCTRIELQARPSWNWVSNQLQGWPVPGMMDGNFDGKSGIKTNCWHANWFGLASANALSRFCCASSNSCLSWNGNKSKY